jgi:CHAT domain-containing protein
MLPEPDRRLLVERDLEVCLLATERDLVDDASSVAERPQALVAFGGADFTTARRGPSSHEPGTRPAPAPVATLSMADLVEPSGTIADLPLRFDPAPCAGSKRRFAPLPQSAIEVSEVGTLARAAGLDALVLVGAEASEAAFKQLAPGRAYVHLASHGFWLDDTCRVASRAAGSGLLRSGIVLAGANAGVVDPATGEDGILTAEEIGGLDLRGTQVLVLSACETGLGEGVPWEGVVGVKRAFRGAGAEALVTSLWKVDDRAAREWMREFYHALWSKAGDPGRAGRAATRALVARDRAAGREPDPFTCGAFVVTASGPGR